MDHFAPGYEIRIADENDQQVGPKRWKRGNISNRDIVIVELISGGGQFAFERAERFEVDVTDRKRGFAHCAGVLSCEGLASAGALLRMGHRTINKNRCSVASPPP